ncbi:hypothetical protein E3T43_07365 [Cryobacterium sp. Hh7]|uniref:hypothetical protein n=1 Tax=Cryobacterium sp. Hh7 TaxID=1259159 RepID=UPI001069925E|nr:hypothetical protein [Cryobacterium sp. Hh7]TFD58056.1 hypothetical protein E3T43_07365 [Cryobacterium sp. Hh7]
MTAARLVAWDLGDSEPEGVISVCESDGDTDGEDSICWGRTHDGDWKGYKNGGKVYLSWDELTRRWGPIAEMVTG